MAAETRTLYHATDASNVDSIKADGLHSDNRDLTFFTDSVEEAKRIGEIYPTIDDTAVFAAEVQERNLTDDPDPHGDLTSFAHRGAVPSHNLERVA